MTDRGRASITQTRRPNFDRLGAGKNARAPARAGTGNVIRSAAVPGRIQSDDRSYDPHRSRKPDDRTLTCWGGQEWPRSCRRVGKHNGLGSAAVPGHTNPTADRAPRFDHTNPQPNIYENLKKLRISPGFQPLLSSVCVTYLGRCPRLV